ncbi:unnamed protein product, partial [Diamesa hyperborea]
SISEFLKDLPCVNEQNFSLYNTDSGRTSSKHPSIYLPTIDLPSDQIIITEKKNILLRYLHSTWDKKNAPKKRESSDQQENTTARKRQRLEMNN